MGDEITAMRQKIADLGGLMFSRFLTDSAGGNISARVGDVVCITARHSGSKYRWQIRPEQVIVTDLDGKKLDGDGEISREAKVHLRLFKDYPDGRAVVHGHARNVLVFCAAGVAMPPVLEDTLKFGVIPVSRYSPAHSAELAEYISEAFHGQEERIRQQAAAVLAPWHGLFVLAKDLDAAYDTAERLDVNAHIILSSRLLGADFSAEALNARLEADYRNFNKA